MQVSEVASLIYSSWRLTAAESAVRALVRCRFDCAVLLRGSARAAMRKALVEGGGAGIGDAADAIFACWEGRQLRTASEVLKCICIAAPSSTVFVAAVRAAAFALKGGRLAEAWEDMRSPAPCAMTWSQLSDIAQAAATGSGGEPVEGFLERHLWPPLAAAGWTVEPVPPRGRRFVAPPGSALHGQDRLLALSLVVGFCHLNGSKAGLVPPETVNSIRAEQAPALVARWAMLQPAAAASAAVERLRRDGAALGSAVVVARNGSASAPRRPSDGRGSGSESQTDWEQPGAAPEGGPEGGAGVGSLRQRNPGARPPLASLWGHSARLPRDDGGLYRHNKVYMTQRGVDDGRFMSRRGGYRSGESGRSAPLEDHDQPATSSEQATPSTESEGDGTESNDNSDEKCRRRL
ncbi:hypothetical protein Rsub_08197 [Raphidocelis subcapitata]|uniref:Uncharacterized protein n=1 Tax=Raphidocelis subcapitata TaxID=307507 RepID=A0A2V0P7A8_9CHLO|nr:hypothetical protein Rsub_08197 [Raphidocelis subcapitata]|eukprot:GBF95761.1 hypothetical protein Rsub_08197 [Raphidocelis subcapitata]